MDEAVALLLLRYLFPDWVITRDEGWSAVRKVSGGDLDELLALLAVVDPEAVRRAVRALSK